MIVIDKTDVDKARRAQRECKLASIFDRTLFFLFRNLLRGAYGDRIRGMNSGSLNLLCNSGDEIVLAIRYNIQLHAPCRYNIFEA